MSAQKIITPIATNQTNQCTITPPWFVNGSEYHPLVAAFQPLVNGENAFSAVYEAINAAKKSVCIICWGFQPSMYFVRSEAGNAMPIGGLLQLKAMQGVKVRILCYAFEVTFSPYLFGPDFVQRYVNVTGVKQGLDESNTPGRHDLRMQDRPPTSNDDQYQYDVRWYALYDDRQEIEDVARKKLKAMFGDTRAANMHFVSRGFSDEDRARIGMQDHADKGLSTATKATLSATPSHHQKMVLVDYDDPQHAVGFVMGHNMLDEYWDTSKHSYRQYRNRPAQGRNGALPREDFSSRVRGPILGDLFANFSQAWEKETGESLPKADFSHYPPGSNRREELVMAQLLRTQPQYGVQDIKKLYLQAVNNATQYIYIENQYVRWPPLAEKIKAAAKAQTGASRSPDKHGALHLFVITNSTDSGMGAGVVNTYRMLDSLGRADTIPAVTRLERTEDVNARLGQTRMEADSARRSLPDLQFAARQNPNGILAKRYAEKKEQLKALEEKQKAQEKELAKLQDKDGAVLPEERPGLKIHVCTLVAPDTPDKTDWMDVYIHAKLMLIDDAFMTLGSANINTRSMEVDSELNITHHRPEITQPLRRELWNLHTNGMGAQDDPGAAFKAWADVIKKNKTAKQDKLKPKASLVEFYRGSPERKNMD